MFIRAFLRAGILLLITVSTIPARQGSSLDEVLRAIFERNEYRAQTFGPSKWWEEGRRYTTLEPSAAFKDAKDIVAYDTASGTRDVVISAAALKPAGASAPLEIDEYSWSKDRSRLLVFTNSKKVWRDDTRGDYWTLDLGTKKLRRLGGDSAPSTLMFAKFSPDGSRVGYVRENNIYVEDVGSGAITQLTDDGSATTINGTSDWVYEEELSLRDCFRWSPDGGSIAYWQFDSSGIEMFTLINDTDSLYPTLTRFPYPKVGTTNSAVRIGVVSPKGGATTWMTIPGNPRESYLARMEWLSDSATLMIQRLNRLQNTNEVLLADAKTGTVRSPYRETSRTWLDVVDGVEWLNDSEFLWISEKDGWRHGIAIKKEGTGERLITRFDGDILSLKGADIPHGWLYFMASPENATQSYLYRSNLDGTGRPLRVTPTDQPGWHTYNVSPDRQWAIHTYSRFDMPPRTELISLPDHHVAKTLTDNPELRAKVASLTESPVQFLRVDIGDGVVLDGYMLKPANFDPNRKYPLVIYVYGEVASQTVLDRWGGNREFFLRAIANEGYVVASVDNRGTPAPKGAAWRKVVYGSIGDLSSREQAAAVRAIAAMFPFIDSSRVGIWGWSGGGTNTLNAMFRFPNIYKVGVAVAPEPDQQLYDTIYQERYMGLPKDNAEGYRIGSAINFAEGLQGKLLIIHGSGDDNVHYQGTERLVNRLIELGKPFDLMVYPNRTHAISEGKGTTLHIYSLIGRYFREHL
jgi:dipeptidyl-peptidase-4